MKTLKSDIFYAMNEINDKYILEAAQCLEQKKENDISLQKNSKLFHESNAHSRKWLARVATAMAVSIILFTTGGIANAATGGKLVQWINGLFFGIAKPSTSDEIKTSYLRGTFSIDYSDLNAVVGDADYVFVGTVASEEGTVYKDAVTVETDDGKTREVSGPYTNYTVNVTKNIKGNLVTDTAIPIQKSGGLSEDGSQYFVYEGDELPVVGNEYIFFAYAQPDGSLLISGPVSNMSVSDNTSDIAPSSDSTEYSDIVDAYNNQVDSGRTRFTSSYEAK